MLNLFYMMQKVKARLLEEFEYEKVNAVEKSAGVHKKREKFIIWVGIGSVILYKIIIKINKLIVINGYL